MRLHWTDFVYGLLPLVAGFSTSAVFPVGRNAGASVVVRPPPAAFGVAWAILFSLMGASWTLAAREGETLALTTVLYGTLLACLLSWMVVYVRVGPREAAWVLVGSVAASVACCSQGGGVSQALLSPLVAWLIFALVMNCIEVQTVE